MKKIFKFYFLIFISISLFVSISFSQSEPVIKSEGTIILNAPWGDGEEAFGLLNAPEVERVGPLSFNVQGKNILILDTVNRGVKILDKGEKLRTLAKNIEAEDIISDGGKDFFILFEGKITHYSEKGEVKNNFSISFKNEVIQGYGSYLSIVNEKLSLNNVDQKTFTVAKGSSVKGFTAVEEKDSAKIFSGKEGLADNLTYSIKRLAGDDIRILGADPDEKILVSVKIQMDGDRAGAVLFKGQDNSGNLYTEIERLTEKGTQLEVHKYTKTGERTAIYKMPNKYFTTIYKKTEITPNGDVYQLYTTPDGVQIIKY